METVIEYRGKLYPFKKPIYLTDAMFYDRCWYIVKNNSKENIEEYANMWIAHKYFTVDYDPPVMQILYDLEQNVAAP